MDNAFIINGPAWTFIDRNQPEGEHCFAEQEIKIAGESIFIQADFFESEYTFSATSRSARPFFDETADGTTELPPLLEVFNVVPSFCQSQYADVYAELKVLLDKVISPQRTLTTADGMAMLKQFFANRQKKE